MKKRNEKRMLIAAAAVLIANLAVIGNASADIVVDPRGHSIEQLQQDQMECKSLAAGIDFNMAEEHQGRAVLRGAAVAGGAAAIAGGGKEMRRRSAGLGALAGGMQRNKGKRVDGSAVEVKRNDAERNCLIGRGYNPIS